MIRIARLAEHEAALPALEHALWCAEQGMTPGDVFRALQESAPVWPTWSWVVHALMVEHNAIRRRQARSLLREVA